METSSNISSVFSSMTSNINELSNNMTSYASTMDTSNPEDDLYLQQYEYEYETAIDTASALIYDMKDICTTIASNMK